MRNGRRRTDWNACLRAGPAGLMGNLRRRMSARLRHAADCQSGVSAVEFALIAPLLVFGLLATWDVGLAAYERITMDHVLRAGAQSAMVDPGNPDVVKVLEATADLNFLLVRKKTKFSTREPIHLSSRRFCACPDNKDVEVACGFVCPSAAKPFGYYRLTAKKVYSGMIMPRMTFDLAMEVQVQ